MKNFNALENLTPELESTLKEEIIVSLFTNQRAENGVGGWWAQSLDDQAHFGSKLWLLEREKLVPETLERASIFAKEALAWIEQENKASELHVNAQFIPHGILLTIELVGGHKGCNAPQLLSNYWQFVV